MLEIHELEMQKTLIRTVNLKKYYKLGRRYFSGHSAVLKALNGVTLNIQAGETLGLVGESGCGKSTFGRLLVRLERPTSGEIYFKGEDISFYKEAILRPLRKNMQIVFQDPYSSLNPKMTVGDIVSESMRVHNLYPKSEIDERTIELLCLVGLTPEDRKKYPEAFSGGQRQRIGIARALSVKPEFVVADEPVSALDVSIQAQIVNLLLEIQEKFNITYLFITHDLRLVEYICDRVAVMYLGRIVEFANTEDVYKDPLHPYTRMLLSSQPGSDFDTKLPTEKIYSDMDVPSPLNLPSGCVFRPRCSQKRDVCAKEVPILRDFNFNHKVACHLIK